MKHFILLVSAALVGSISFASMQTSAHSNSSLTALSSAFQSKPAAHLIQQSNPITTVYAGEDVSRTKAISFGTNVA